MTKINTINPKGDIFLVHTDDYDVQFDAVNVTVAGVAGDVLENASTKINASSTEVLGILAEDSDGIQGNVRVMVRGNPSTVDAEKINTFDSTDALEMLEAKGIVAVNEQD